MTQQTDARSIVTTQTFDDLDRIQQRSWSDGTATVTYTYDGAASQFRLGRLASIAQAASLVSYAYDAFGRMTQDGALTYAYDANGNRKTIGYGGGLFACYSFDDADRQSTLSLGNDAGCIAGAQSLVTASSYLASGPLSSLTLGNGVVETHAYDQRSFPTEIRAKLGAADRLWWTLGYGTGAAEDKVGNIKTVLDNLAPTTRTYNYQKPQYFLTQGDGPWGTRSWTYDRIGNRLSETRSGVTDTYIYLSGHNPKLQSITSDGGAGSQAFTYDSTGNKLLSGSPTSEIVFSYDAANRLTGINDDVSGAETHLTHDGRNYLAQARQDLNSCNPVVTQAAYDSSGMLLGRKQLNLLTGLTLKDAEVFYFAGRPVAIRETASSTATKYLTVDHLGTPILMSDGSGVGLWSGGFEPFGKDFSNAQGAGEFLRFPGQWDDPAWSGSGQFYNVNRWYISGLGTYSQPDSLDLETVLSIFAYADDNPVEFSDPLGLVAYKGGVPEVGPALAQLLACIESCAGSELTITSSHEAIKQHQPGTPHRRGDAADVRYSPAISETFLCCANSCGAGFALDESKHPSQQATAPHFHVQLTAGKRGGSGDLSTAPTSCRSRLGCHWEEPAPFLPPLLFNPPLSVLRH